LTSRSVGWDVNGVKTFRRAYARDDGAPNEDMNKGVVAVTLCRNMATGIAQCYRENRKREEERERKRERERVQHEREKDVGLERVCAPKRTRGSDREKERQGVQDRARQVAGARVRAR